MESMTIGNITGGFRVTGVYPVNRDVFSSLGDGAELPRESGIPFIPLYSPASKHAPRLSVHELWAAMDQDNDDEDEDEGFTEDECVQFQRRYDNGYDLVTDSRYNLWLKKYHPNAASRRVWMQPVQCTAVSKFLRYHSPPSHIPGSSPKPCGRVLTSTENLAVIWKKEEAKLEKEKAKE